jgi:HK97 family phage major capsid protein/HK97 family phage prohead protease
MNRAYSVLAIKAVDEEQRVITGVATTPTPDRMGDVVEPLGVKFKNPLALLWQHRHDQPVGSVKFDKPTKDGITFTATLAKIAEPGTLKDRIDEAWQSVKAGLVRAVSIGFRPLEYSITEDGGYRFMESEVIELSLVTIPANADATINQIRSIDQEQRAASGQTLQLVGEPGPEILEPPTPGATGRLKTAVKAITPTAPKEGNTMKTVAEQIAAFEATRQAKSARMNELMSKAAEEGVTLDAAESEEYDTLEAEIAEVDKHLVRLRKLEQTNVSKAVDVTSVDSAAVGSDARGGVRVEVKGSNLPKGTAFTRYAMALARSKGNLMQAVEVSKAWADSTPEVETVLKAAVSAGTTTDSDWAAPLVEYQNMASEFAELLRPQTIVGRIQGLRRVPFNIKVPRQTGGSSASWVGEGAPKPVSELAFDQITLGMTKLAGIVVITDELARASNPAAETIVRQDLIDTIVYTMDRDFVDPANAGTSNVKPASIINGVTPVVASGTDPEDLRTDLRALRAKFLAANLSLNGAVYIMTEQMADVIADMQNALGQPEYRDMGGDAPRIGRIPVITSENIPANAGSGSPLTGDGGRIILVKASEVLLADDGQTLLDASREAMLQMESAPTNPPTASTVFTSLWQTNQVGIRAERFVNWAKRRAGAAQYIDSARYGDAA